MNTGWEFWQEWLMLGSCIFGVFVAMRRVLPKALRELDRTKIFFAIAPFVVGIVGGTKLWTTDSCDWFRAGLYGLSTALYARGCWLIVEAVVRRMAGVLPDFISKALGVTPVAAGVKGGAGEKAKTEEAP